MVSIIIPCYNGSKWLAEAIESALIQPLSEVIVVDDGSTDNSLEIARKYEEQNPFRLKVISQVNKGLASARNTGIMNSFYKLILPLDADDILMDGAVKRILEVWQQTDADIIAPSMRCFGESNQDIILMENPTIEDFKTANRIGYCSAIRKQALLEVGGYNPKMTWGAEDYDLWFDLLKRGKKLVTIPEVLWKYRLKKESMWTETQKHKDEFMKQIKLNHPEVWQNS